MEIEDFTFESTPTNRVRSVSFCAPGQLRKRKVVTRSRARETGKFPSVKNNRGMQWESKNERNGFVLLEVDPRVRRYGEQPCEIEYLNDEGRIASHFPDVASELGDSKQLIEIKEQADANRAMIQSRTDLLTEELPRFGYQYTLWIAEDLARQPRLKNSRKILYFGRRAMSELDRMHLQQAMRGGKPLTWGQACAGAYGEYGREILCRAVLDGILQFNINEPFSSETTFFPGTQEVM
jgi:hypothetical protein